MKLELEKPHFRDLLITFGRLLDELKKRGIVRSMNNPVGDYSEWLVSRVFRFKLQPNSNRGFDAIDSKGIKYQIKGRRLNSSNKSRQLGVIRNLGDKKFNFLIAVLFDKDFSVLEAYKIPHRLISRYSKFSKHQNGHIMILRGDVLTAEGVERIGKRLNRYAKRKGA